MTAKLDPRWTIAELESRVEAALTKGYSGQDNGQVRAVPDLRTIRYYTTLGLIDRPLEMRGRTAIYGLKHLLQLVAIKRLQSEGRSLAVVQEALSGLTLRELKSAAGLDEGAVARLSRLGGAIVEEAPSREGSFWREIPTAGPARQPPAAEMVGVALTSGVSLLFSASRPLNDEDRRALRDAAGPILRELEIRGLLGPSERKPR